MTFTKLLDQRNILIAGGAGFIGSHLCDELVKTANVICVDSFITGQEENIDLLLQNPSFKFLRHDISKPLDLEQYPELETFKVKFQGIQEIYNLACPTSPRDYNRLPIETLQANGFGTINLLEMARKYQAKYLHASSSAVYGEPRQGEAFSEDYWGFIDPVGPRSCYNEGKRFAESLVTNYGKSYNLSVRIARIFNTYGPRMKQNDGRMIPDFVAHAVMGRPVIVYGSLDAPATYCYVSDMVDGLVKLMEAEQGGIYNLGSDALTSIGAAVGVIQKIVGSSAGVEVAESLPYLARQGHADITRAKNELGWFPLTGLETGLAETIEYFKAHQRVLGMPPQA